ncbi:MAG: hypothetical protein AAF431_08895 [Pseudomonadota bacterium]
MIRRAIWLTLLISFSGAWAESTTINASGSGATLQQALNNAQRSAVESALGVYLESQTLVKNYIVESDQIFSISEGVVSKYDVVRQTQGADGEWVVDIRAVVSGDKLQGNITLLLRQIDNPKSMVIVDPAARSRSEFSRQAHREINAALLAEGFEVINQDISVELRAEVADLMDVNQVGQTAAKMALRYNADVAWMVEVQESQQTSYGVTETVVEVGCQVISAASGQIFADAQIRVSGLTPQEAAVKAGKQLAAQLVNNVKIQFANLAQQGNRYSVRLWGIDSYRQARGLRRTLEGIRGFSDVKQNAIALDSDSTAQNFVDLSVVFKGTTDQLIDQVFDNADPNLFKTLDLRLQRATQIEFQL